LIWQAFLDGYSIFIEQWPVVLAILALMFLGFSPVFFLLRGVSRKKVAGQSILLLIFFLTITVILRLTFMTGTIVPPYFDSVEHFRLSQELVTALESSSLLATIPTLTPSYYHLGFHLLASFLTFGLRANPIDVILVLGQVTLAMIPIPIFFLIRHETRSAAAVWFGTLLAGFGWYMPGFAVNWGKYPALAGLLATELVLSFAYFAFDNKRERSRTALSVLLVLGILVSTLFHSRTLIVIVISIASWTVAGKIQNLSKVIQYLLLTILLAAILFLGILIQDEPLLNLALDPYLDDGIWVTLTVIVVSLFALSKYPRGIYFSMLFMFLVLVTLFVPIERVLPGIENQTLLDRPFVEIVLYLPLSLLGGLGFAGLLRFIRGIKIFPEKLRSFARILLTILIIGGAGLLSIGSYDFYPSDCCKFVGDNDVVAFDWLNRNTPPDARILIASTQMHVFPTGPSAASVGTDAGIWIPALTGRTTSFATFDTDFRYEGTLAYLCREQIDYVYVGGTEQNFNAELLQAKPDWYETILSLPDAQLYGINGCTKQ
jgi:hypothetical protein